MKFINTFMSIAISTVMITSMTACQQAKTENPLLQESDSPYNIPDFDMIQVSDYLPAFEAAIKDQRENIQKIVDCPDSATFKNTILAR